MLPSLPLFRLRTHLQCSTCILSGFGTISNVFVSSKAEISSLIAASHLFFSLDAKASFKLGESEDSSPRTTPAMNLSGDLLTREEYLPCAFLISKSESELSLSIPFSISISLSPSLHTKYTYLHHVTKEHILRSVLRIHDFFSFWANIKCLTSKSSEPAYVWFPYEKYFMRAFAVVLIC